MKAWRRFVSWMRALLRRSRMEREMAAELRFHIEAYAGDLIRSGVPRSEAMRRARMEFGGIEQAKDTLGPGHRGKRLAVHLRDGLDRTEEQPGQKEKTQQIANIHVNAGIKHAPTAYDEQRVALGVADELRDVPGVTTRMMVALGENGASGSSPSTRASAR